MPGESEKGRNGCVREKASKDKVRTLPNAERLTMPK